jgi:hypothetical protein
MPGPLTILIDGAPAPPSVRAYLGEDGALYVQVGHNSVPLAEWARAEGLEVEGVCLKTVGE